MKKLTIATPLALVILFPVRAAVLDTATVEERHSYAALVKIGAELCKEGGKFGEATRIQVRGRRLGLTKQEVEKSSAPELREVLEISRAIGVLPELCDIAYNAFIESTDELLR